MSAALHIAETTENQRRAADPSLSAFVSANAGSGKTRVLTNRVARLLLEDIDPSTILCITFTKAAAAEMAERLFKLLGEWALADDAKLQAALAELDGDARIRAPKELARARRLFARALETPGGLKIQTIHSFCEGVLKRFPLEADAPPGFSIIEELESRRLKKEAMSRVAQANDAAIREAFARLLGRMSGFALRGLLENGLSSRRKFARALEIGWMRLGEEIAAALGADGASADELTAALIASLPRDRLEDACAALDASGGNPQKYCAAPLKIFLAADDDETRLASLTSLFLDSKGGPRKSFGTKATEKIDASIEGFLLEAQIRFLDGIDRIRAANAADDTRAFLTLIERAFAEYDDAKRRRATLDFDDLIEKTRALFRSDGGAQWVLYKLDKGLSHILLDEAQDTGPDAWDVVEAPLAEFFAGSGVRETARTFFAVGDQKQSIYSFQGADAALINDKEKDLGKKIGAVQPYANVPLKASFRTTSPVLEFVDALFARDEVVENVSDVRPLSHHCTREGDAGCVELWPLVKKAEREKPNPWEAPLDAAPADNPSRRLAREIAELIAGWLRDVEILQSQGRPIEPGDIMILVQSRGALFSEIIRALGAARVPVAGADKIALTEDQGVLDLLSFARTALFDGDDLSLAETLKSPFFNVDEESLFELAADRRGETLQRALERRRDERAEWRAAHDEIAEARRIALEEGAVSFFTHILEGGAPSGWRRLAERLGKPSREPIEEFLRQAYEFEMRNPRSLRLFLDAVVKSGAEVSRDAAEAGPLVRVLTAHKAKGLEANIVFLIDAHRNAQVGKVGALATLTDAHGDYIPVLAIGDAARNSVIAAARDRAKTLMRDEYRRLLYVAATRARDRLYVCGVESGRSGNESAKPAAEKSWRALAEDAFDALGARIEDAGERFEGRVRRLSSSQTRPPKPDKNEIQRSDAAPADCLFQPAAPERRSRALSPSRLLDDSDRDQSYSPLRGRDPFLRGRILHRLLEILPDVDPAGRESAAERLLSYHARAFDETARDEMRREALRVLNDPQFADVFSPAAIAEAAIGGKLPGGLSLFGQIDRLAILEDRILAVDYKTNRPPPLKVEDVPLAYIGQMAAYRALLREIWPGRRVEAALLWTYDARLMPLPDGILDHAETQILTLA